MQNLVGHAAQQQGGKIGVTTRAHHDQAGPVLLGGVQDEAGRGAVHGVAKVDAGSQPPGPWRTARRAGSPLGPLEVALKGDPRWGGRSVTWTTTISSPSALAILAASSTAFSVGLDPPTASRMVPNTAGSPPWVAWLAAISIGRHRPSRLAGLPAEDGPTKGRRTPRRSTDFGTGGIGAREAPRRPARRAASHQQRWEHLPCWQGLCQVAPSRANARADSA